MAPDWQDSEKSWRDVHGGAATLETAGGVESADIIFFFVSTKALLVACELLFLWLSLEYTYFQDEEVFGPCQ